MALDVALVLRLVDRLSGPLKKPIASTGELGRTATAGVAALERFGGVTGDVRHFDRLSGVANKARSAIERLGPSATRNSELIGAQQADIGHFRKLKTEVSATEVELSKARGRAADLGRQLKLTQAQTKVDPKEVDRLTRAFDKATGSVKKLKQAQINQTLAIQKSSDKAARLREQLRLAREQTNFNPEKVQRLTRSLGDANRATQRLKTRHQDHAAALEKAKGNAAGLARQLKLTKAETKVDPKEITRLSRELDKANRAAKRLKSTHHEQSVALDTVRRGLSEAGINTRNLASESRRLTRETEAHSRALERQNRIRERMAEHRGRLASINERMERNQSRRANARGAAFEAGAIGYGAMRFIGGAGESQSTLVDIGITADVSNEKLERLRETVARVAVEAFQPRNPVMAAQQQLTASGLDFAIAEEALLPIARTATAGQAEVPDVARSAFAAIDNLKVPVDQLGKFFDMMTIGGKEGRFEMRDQARHFAQQSAIAVSQNMLGLEGAATLIAANQIAIKGAGTADIAANNLTNFLRKLSMPETIGNFEKVGIDLSEQLADADAIGESRFDRVIQLLEEYSNGDIAKVQEIFRDAEVLGFLNPMLANGDEFNRIRQAALNAEGTVDADFARRTAEDPTLQWRRFGDDLGKFRDKVALPLIPVITDLMQAVTPLVEKFGEWAAANPELIGQIGWMIGILLTMKVGLLAAAFAATTLVTPLLWMGKGLQFARMGLTLLGLTGGGTIGLLGRLGVASGGLIGRVAGLGWAFGKGLVADLGRIGGAMTRFGGPVLRGVVGGGLNFVKFGLQRLGLAMLANPVGAVIAGLAAVAFVLWDNWEKVTGWFDAKTERIKSAFGDGFLNGMIQLVHEFNPFRLLWDTLDGLVDYLFGIDLSGWFSGLTSQIADMVSGLRDLLGLRDAEDERTARIAAAAERQTQAAFEQSDKGKAAKGVVQEYVTLKDRGLAAPAPLQVVPGYSDRLARQAEGLPTLAGMRAALGIDGERAGGGSVWSGGSFLVGERGPEIITTARSGFVLPNAATMALLASPLAAAASPLSHQPALTLDTRPALSGASSAQQSAGGHFNASPNNAPVSVQIGDINIYAQPGQDAQDIALEVRRELKNLMRDANRSDADLHDGGILFDE